MMILEALLGDAEVCHRHGMNVEWEDDDEVKMALKNGVYTIRNILVLKGGD